MSITLYGIKACDTMKKAMTWLNDKGISYEFHDYKKQGIDRDSLARWLEQKPWDELINKRGTTWRKLNESDKENIDNEKAIELMLNNTSLIKRPVLENNSSISLGFKPELYEQIFND